MTEKQKATTIDVEGDAVKDAEAAAAGFGASVIDRLADRIGAHAGSGAVFGKPVEKDGRTIITVAQSMWGSGAGTGDSDEYGAGAGGGGGAMTRPLGYIEITDEHATFVPLQQPWQDVKLVLAYSFAVWLLARALNRILRG
ncbi:MAG: spore germination protein GerW family protein [Chloroflexota bacterium]